MLLVMAAMVAAVCLPMQSQEKTKKKLSHVKESLYGGCPIANFGLTVQATPDGNLFGHVWQNTGRLGGWLEDKGSLSVKVRKDGKTYALNEFKDRRVERGFPFVENVYTDRGILSSQLSVTAFAPLGINERETSSLQALMTEITLENSRGKEESLELCIAPKLEHDGQWQSAKGDAWNGAKGGNFCLSSNQNARWENGELIIPITVGKKEETSVKLLLTAWDDQWISALQFGDAQEITDYVHSTWDALHEKTELFSKAIPATGTEDLDEYLRWYMTAGISLTRCTRRGEMLTLGYQELNQRDSYWSSWVHLVMFKNLEWDIIQGSYDRLREDGKMPTCVLPLIEREDDLDINLFLLMRTMRYYALYHNKDQVGKLWSKMCLAMNWVVGRDFDGKGLPQQISFWGDWKDVNYYEERRYSPFVSMLYLATLEQMSAMALELDDKAAAEKYEALYQKAFQKANLPVEQGGLWNGDFYCQIWKDGSVKDVLAQDQMVGVMFDVIPSDKAGRLIDALNKNNYSKFGISNTYPFIPNVRDPEAEYHNGGVWPWVCFMDAWGRMRLGHTEEALDLIRRVAKADLVDSGDYVPNEHLNSQTGENLGFPIQGWNAALFGTIYFNLIHPELPYKLGKKGK